MKIKDYSSVTAVIFTLIAILHALRLYSGWAAEIGGWAVPLWVSWVAVIVAIYLAWQGWSFSKKK